MPYQWDQVVQEKEETLQGIDLSLQEIVWKSDASNAVNLVILRRIVNQKV